MSQPQIVVIGLGATGSATLCQLARRGVRAIGIEQFELAHDHGSSHGPTRIIRLAHFENTVYVPLMRRAYALWREHEQAVGRQLLHLNGLIEIGPADGTLINGTATAVRRYDLPHELLDAATVMRRYPSFRLPPDYVAILQPDGG
jgi:sarcosine oxidase